MYQVTGVPSAYTMYVAHKQKTAYTYYYQISPALTLSIAAASQEVFAPSLNFRRIPPNFVHLSPCKGAGVDFVHFSSLELPEYFLVTRFKQLVEPTPRLTPYRFLKKFNGMVLSVCFAPVET